MSVIFNKCFVEGVKINLLFRKFARFIKRLEVIFDISLEGIREYFGLMMIFCLEIDNKDEDDNKEGLEVDAIGNMWW